MFSGWIIPLVVGETLGNHPYVGYPSHAQKDFLLLTLRRQLLRMHRDPLAAATVQFEN